MIGLTPRQNAALVFIRARVERTGVCPSYEEIGRHLGLAAKSGVHRIVTGLEDRGCVRRLPGRARSLEIVADDFGDLGALEQRTSDHLRAMRDRIDAILKGRAS